MKQNRTKGKRRRRKKKKRKKKERVRREEEEIITRIEEKKSENAKASKPLPPFRVFATEAHLATHHSSPAGSQRRGTVSFAVAEDASDQRSPLSEFQRERNSRFPPFREGKASPAKGD